MSFEQGGNTERVRLVRRDARLRRAGLARYAAVLVLLNVFSVFIGTLIIRGVLADLRTAHVSKAQWTEWIASAISLEEHLTQLSREMRVIDDESALPDRRGFVDALSERMETELRRLGDAAGTARLANTTRLAAKVRIARSEMTRGLESAVRAFEAAEKGDHARVHTLSAASAGAFEEAREQVILMKARFRNELKGDIDRAVGKERALSTMMVGISVGLLVVAGLIAFTMFRLVRRLNEVESVALRHRRRERIALAEASRAAGVKADFLAHMSHELRTPLTSILGYVSILLDEGDRTKAPPARIEALRTIKSNSAHLLRVLSDVIELSGLNAGPRLRANAALEIGGLIEAAFGRVNLEAAGRGLKLEFESDGRIPRRVLADAPLVTRVLDVLVGNAVKFTERGSIRVRVSYDAGSSQMRISVIDTGIGMTDAQLAKLFKEFEQGDASMARRYGGAGLGLAIAHRAATHLGGRLAVTSTPGAGSTFVFELPAPAEANCEWGNVSQAVPTASEAAQKQVAAALVKPDTLASAVPTASTAPTASPAATAGAIKPLAGRTIVLAEDTADIRRLLSTLLRSAGAEVVLAENGKEAVDRVREMINTGCAPWLVFMDMQMPVMDGYEATRVLRNSGVTLPIVALTAHALPEDRNRCLDAGCSEHVAKPVTRATLIDACLRMGREPDMAVAA